MAYPDRPLSRAHRHDLLTVTICSVQACNKKGYDVYIMYAGVHDVERTASGSVSEYETLLQNFKRITDDHDGDGEPEARDLCFKMVQSGEAKDMQEAKAKWLAQAKQMDANF